MIKSLDQHLAQLPQCPTADNWQYQNKAITFWQANANFWEQFEPLFDMHWKTGDHVYVALGTLNNQLVDAEIDLKNNTVLRYRKGQFDAKYYSFWAYDNGRFCWVKAKCIKPFYLASVALSGCMPENRCACEDYKSAFEYLRDSLDLAKTAQAELKRTDCVSLHCRNSNIGASVKYSLWYAEIELIEDIGIIESWRDGNTGELSNDY